MSAESDSAVEEEEGGVAISYKIPTWLDMRTRIRSRSTRLSCDVGPSSAPLHLPTHVCTHTWTLFFVSEILYVCAARFTDLRSESAKYLQWQRRGFMMLGTG